MLRKIVTVLILLTLSVFAYQVKVVTNVPGVSVYLNSKLMGITDETGEITFDATGAVIIQATKQGYWPRKLRLEANIQFDRTFKLFFYPVSRAFLDTDPQGADVFISYGESLIYLGKTPYYGEVPIGEHTLVIRKKDYPEFKRSVVFKSQIQKITLKIPNYGYCYVKTTPAASVVVDGVYKGDSPVGFKIGVGEHSFEFYKEGLLIGKNTFKITSEPTEINLKLRDIAKISFHSYPAGAQMKIGSKVYELPVTLKIVEGDYPVELSLPGFKTLKKTVTIYKDMKTLTFKLEEEKYRVVIPFKGDIEIDGRSWERGPLTTYVKKGFHILHFKNDYGEWYKTFFVTTDSSLTIDTEKGTVIIPDVGRIVVNGVQLMTPAIMNLSPGKYTFEMLGVKETIDVKSGKVEMLPKGFGAVTVNSFPEGLTVSFDGEEFVTPVFLYPLPPGEKEIIFKKGCATWHKTVKIKEGNISFVNLEIPLSNILKVPDIRNCEIIVDGEKIEELADLNIGFHLLALKCGKVIDIEPFCYSDNERDLPFPLGGEAK